MSTQADDGVMLQRETTEFLQDDSSKFGSKLKNRIISTGLVHHLTTLVRHEVTFLVVLQHRHVRVHVVVFLDDTRHEAPAVVHVHVDAARRIDDRLHRISRIAE